MHSHPGRSREHVTVTKRALVAPNPTRSLPSSRDYLRRRVGPPAPVPRNSFTPGRAELNSHRRRCRGFAQQSFLSRLRAA
jgi:hypothetical protein